MPPLLRVVAPLAVLAVVPVACSSARSPDGAPPVALVEPAAPPPARTETAPTPSTGAADCSASFVEVIDAGKTVRYLLGRELVPGVRGAKHAYGEEVLHHDGSVVLHVEGIARPDGRQGHVSLSITGFREPASLPAAFDEARVEYMAPGLERERDERRLGPAHVEITSWGTAGDWIEGTFGPAPGAQAVATFRGRFRVCRSADWRVRI